MTDNPIQLYCGDCLDIMRQMPDKSVDLILTDPPYNAKDIGPKQRKYATGTMQLPLPEYIKFCQDWIKEALRISKTVVFTSGIANVCYYPQPNWIICWHKPAACSFNRYGGYNTWEPIMVYGKIAKGKRLKQDYLLYNTLNFSTGIEKKHPCPKVPELIEYLVDIFSLENDTVLDCFMGSGTTGVACVKLNRRFRGIEISREYYDLARSRINKEIAQGDMFRTLKYEIVER